MASSRRKIRQSIKNQKQCKRTTKNFQFGVLIFVSAFLIRFLHLWRVKDNILIKSPVSDCNYYFNRAAEILKGNLIPSEPSFYSALLYPYVLAPLLAVGQGGFFALFFQILIGSSTCFLVYLIGKKIFNEFSGIAAGLVAAFYGFAIFAETQFLGDFLVPFFLCVMVVIILYSRNRIRYFFAGIPLGLSALCRATTLIFVPFFLIFLFLRIKKIRKVATHFGLSLLGITLPMIPFAYINYKTVGSLSPVSSGGGMAFFVGNHADATGGFSIPKEIWSYYNFNLPETSKKVAEIETGRKMTEMEVSTYWLNKALNFVRKNPLTVSKLAIKKFVLFWNKYENTSVSDFYFFKNKYRFLKFSLSFGIFAPVGLLGIVLSDKRRSIILHFLLLSILLTNVIFFVSGRFRLPATLFLTIFGGYALFSLWSQLRKKTHRRIWLSFSLLIFFYLFVNLPEFTDVRLDPGHIHSLMSTAYAENNNREREIQELQKCLEVSPRSPFAHARLGEIYWQLGRYRISIDEYEKEILVNPHNAVVHAELGRRYGMTGDFHKAHKHLEIALNLAPMMIEARTNMGVVYRKQKEYDKAVEELQKALRIDPAFLDAWYNIGNVYRDKGNIDLAIFAYTKALDLKPRDPEVRRYLETMIQKLSYDKIDN